MSDQEQFLDVIDRDEAERRFRAALSLKPLGAERILLGEALGRVLACDVVARVDVPSFDRSNFDGFAVRAADTFGSSELAPQRVRLLDEILDAGTAPAVEVQPGEAVAISTGGMIPRGADAILMVEHSEVRAGRSATVVPPLRRRDIRSAERPDYSNTSRSTWPLTSVNR